MSMRYVLREGVSGFRRARLASFTSVLALTLAVLVVGVLARVGWNSYDLARTLRDEIDMEVYLAEGTREEHRTVGLALQRLPIVAGVTYISPDSAAARFKADFGAEGTPFADLDFLPASYVLDLKPDVPVDSIAAAIPAIRARQGVEDVSFNLELVRLIENRMGTVFRAGAGVAALIILVALVLVFNTIRLTIYAKQGIIRAMKLVGATQGFIRRPFLIEGLAQGLLAAGIAVGGTWVLLDRAVPALLQVTLTWPLGTWYWLVGGMTAFSLVLGLLGSWWAARRFIAATHISR